MDDLRRLVPAEVIGKSSPEKWSKQEVLGHLIDAAANNHPRFVRAQHTAELTFPPYDQNAWVGCRRYDLYDWNRLIDLWIAYNRHWERRGPRAYAEGVRPRELIRCLGLV